jgi:hypothetical protein
MLLIIKLLQKLVAALNSDGTPFQVAAGIAMGACLGLTPIGNVHNAIVFLLALILNLSLAGFWLGWALSCRSDSCSTRCSTPSGAPCWEATRCGRCGPR